MNIITRSQWGARAARGSSRVARSRRRTFVVHYDGSHATSRTGSAIPKGIQNYHMDSNGWRDGGYNFVISQAGEIFEMRGWDEVGAHAGSAGNVEGIGVQVHIGGSQEPSQAALQALVWLKGEADRLMGRDLAWRNHGDYMATSCAGQPLRRWLAQGRPVAGGSSPRPPVASSWDGKPIRGGVITVPYGRRGRHWSTDRDRNGNGIHTGEDWGLAGGTPIGTPVHAVVDGTVTIANGGALGEMTILKGDNGRYYRYCHLRKGSRSPWNGERVRAGQKIAEVGNTGNVTAPHLHLEDTTSAQIWPPVGHRQPSWPRPTNSPMQEDDDVPEYRKTRDSFDHPGGGEFSLIYPPGTGWPDAVAAVPVTSRPVNSTVRVHAPAGVEIRTRFVYFDPDNGWQRGMEEIFEAGDKPSFRADTWVGETVDAGYWDIACSEPVKITVEQRSTYYPV